VHRRPEPRVVPARAECDEADEGGAQAVEAHAAAAAGERAAGGRVAVLYRVEHPTRVVQAHDRGADGAQRTRTVRAHPVLHVMPNGRHRRVLDAGRYRPRRRR
jgi:hypothetical protein